MPYPRVVPHSDGSGVIDEIGDSVDPARIGGRVWVFNAQSYRPFGTAAQYTVVPRACAVDLPLRQRRARRLSRHPRHHRPPCRVTDGPVTGQIVARPRGSRWRRGDGRAASHWGGANVIGTVRRSDDLAEVTSRAVRHTVALDHPDAATEVRAHAPDGVDRIIEVAFSDNVDLDAAVARNQTVIAAYATRADRPDFPFWPMLFDNITIRLLGSDDFPADAKQRAAVDLTTAAGDGALTIAYETPLPLDRIAEAHELVDAGGHSRVLLAIPH